MKARMTFLLMLTAGSLAAQQNVGIGTLTPAARLHVVSAQNPVGIMDGPAGMYIQLNEGGVYRGYLGSFAGNAEDVDIGTGSTNNTGKLHLTTKAVPRVTVRENGFVGINSVDPQFLMDVMGRIRIQASTLNSAGTSSGIWYTDYRNNNNIVFAGMADSVNYGFWSQRASVGWKFFFDARYGNVGVGRNPSSGNMRLALDHEDGASIGLYKANAYRGGMSASDSTLELRGDYGGGICFPGPCPPAKDIIIWPPSNCTGVECLGAPTTGRTGFYTNNPNARVHILASTGSAGVLISPSSTTAPADGYMLSVDGKIICEELRVQINTAWPDYVFAPSYPLIPLDELEKKVLEQGHLPGIVSAKEVNATGGVELGSLQQKMLEKVEELYRYVFALHRENKALRAQLMAKRR